MPELFAELKQKRLDIAEILRKAGSLPVGRYSVGRVTSSWRENRERLDDEDTQPATSNDFMHAFALADLNKDSGGPEVLEVVDKIKANPRSLKSACRIEVRRHLLRPILLEGNVGKLPLSQHVKRYVAMDII